jgi:hypothetical protein
VSKLVSKQRHEIADIGSWQQETFSFDAFLLDAMHPLATAAS